MPCVGATARGVCYRQLGCIPLLQLRTPCSDRAKQCAVECCRVGSAYASALLTHLRLYQQRGVIVAQLPSAAGPGLEAPCTPARAGG